MKKYLWSIANVLTLFIQIFRRWHAIIITSICRITLKFTTSHLYVSLWTNLLMFLNRRGNVVITICTITNKLSFWHHIILRMHYLFSTRLSLFQSKLTFVIGLSFEMLSAHLKLSFRSNSQIFLNGILNIITSISSVILKFSLWQYFIVIVSVVTLWFTI